MRYIFFFLSILYSFIFYVFYTFSHKKDIFLHDIEIPQTILNLSMRESIIFSDAHTIILQSFFWNLLYEIIIFLIIAFVFFFYFSAFHDDNNPKNQKKENKPSFFQKIFTYTNFLSFLKKFSYYIWFILFYLSLYLISLWIGNISFSYFIFWINGIIFLYYFSSKFSDTSTQFLRINSIIFSFYYLINYFFIIVWENNYFKWIDFVNGFILLWIFPLLLYFDKKNYKKSSLDNSLLTHFSLYIFWYILFYSYYYIFHQNLLFWISIISSILWVIWFEVIPKIKMFAQDIIPFRYIGIIFTYVGVVFGILFQMFEFSYFLFLVLIGQVWYNAYIHKKYVNYISLFIAIFLGIYLIFYLIFYFNIINYRSIYFFIFTLLLSFAWIWGSYLYKAKYMIDYYVIHIFSHLINLFGVVLFFLFNQFDILYIWILLLVESIYFFASYHKLNSNKK